MIPFEQLAGWVFEELSEDEEAAVEEHLFSCDDCTAIATRLIAIRDGTVELARGGKIRFVATPALEQRIADDELDVRRYDVDEGETVSCHATATQAYAITRLRADLTEVSRLDVRLVFADDTAAEVVEDVPLSAGREGVTIVEPGDVIRSLPTAVVRVELVARDEDGTSRGLGVYRLDHHAME